MVDFTRPVSSIVQGKPAIPVSKDIRGPVNAVAQGIGNVASVFDNRAKIKAANQKAALEARENQALDALALEAFDAMATPEGREINRINNAVKAGSTSSSSGRSRIDVRVRSLLNQYPDMAFEMFQQFDELGIESALFREFKAEQAAMDQQEADVRAANTAARQAAADRGHDISRLNDDVVLAMGRRYMRDAQALAEAKARNEYLFAIEDQEFQRAGEARAQAGEQRAIRSAERDEARLRIDQRQDRRAQENHEYNAKQREIRMNVDETTEIARRSLGMAFTAQLASFSEQMADAISSNDPERLKALDARGSELMAGLRRLEADGLAVISDVNGHTQKDIDDWGEYVQDYVSIIEDLTTGDLSERQNRLNIVEDFANQTQLDFMSIAPTYMRMKTIVGDDAAAQFLMRADADLVADLSEQIGTEMGALWFEMSKDTKDAQGDPQLLNTWKKLRFGVLKAPTNDKELVTALAPTYLPSIEIAAKEAPVSMTDQEAVTILQDIAGPKSSEWAELMREFAPAEASETDKVVAEAIDNAFLNLLMRGGVTSWDRDGVTEGQINSDLALGGALAGQPTFGRFGTASQESSGVKWDAATNTFIGFGGQTAVDKAASLNNGLHWLIDHNIAYNIYSEEETINAIVYERAPNLAPPVDTTGTVNPAAESLPQ